MVRLFFHGSLGRRVDRSCSPISNNMGLGCRIWNEVGSKSVLNWDPRYEVGSWYAVGTQGYECVRNLCELEAGNIISKVSMEIKAHSEDCEDTLWTISDLFHAQMTQCDGLCRRLEPKTSVS